MKMYFNSDKAWGFLLEHGCVFTLRLPNLYAKPNGLVPSGLVDFYRDNAFTGRTGFKKLVSTVDNKGQNTTSHCAPLSVFVSNSGFASVEEWLAEACRLSGEQEAWGVFEVRLFEEAV